MKKHLGMKAECKSVLEASEFLKIGSAHLLGRAEWKRIKIEAQNVWKDG
jgi:hypothetical protein